MHLLFICSRNQWRSPTAEKIFHSDLHPARSAGTEESARTRISEKLIAWADIIFVMDKKHRQRLMQKFSEQLAGKKLVVLDVPDEYQYMDDELIAMLRDSVQPYLHTEQL